ncbi:MAG TPA: ROK family transcriptional regulator [Thermoleophilaceae bacterium]
MGATRSGSLTSLRELNRLRVLETVRERGSVSRADIARQTGLARSTVSSLVTDLQGSGLVVESMNGRDHSGSKGGRPPVLLTLNPSAAVVLGVHFDHRFVRVAVAELDHRILAEEARELDVDHDAAQTFDVAAELADQVVKRSGVKVERLLGAGVAVPGPIDHETGAVGSTTIMPGWVGLDVAAELEERLKLPVHIDNDANLGALAESVLGAGRDVSEMVYVMLSSGIGAGLVLGGRLHRGASGTAGEIGHVLVNEQGPICRCGNRGCLETYAGAGAMLDLLRASHGDLTPDRMIELAQEGDPACRRVLGDAGRSVGSVVAALCNQLNPERVVVGGTVSPAGELVLGPMRDVVRRYAIPAAADDAQVVQGALGERAELLGALILVVGQSDRAFSGRVRAAVGR